MIVVCGQVRAGRVVLGHHLVAGDQVDLLEASRPRNLRRVGPTMVQGVDRLERVKIAGGVRTQEALSERALGVVIH